MSRVSVDHNEIENQRYSGHDRSFASPDDEVIHIFVQHWSYFYVKIQPLSKRGIVSEYIEDGNYIRFHDDIL